LWLLLTRDMGMRTQLAYTRGLAGRKCSLSRAFGQHSMSANKKRIQSQGRSARKTLAQNESTIAGVVQGVEFLSAGFGGSFQAQVVRHGSDRAALISAVAASQFGGV